MALERAFRAGKDNKEGKTGSGENFIFHCETKLLWPRRGARQTKKSRKNIYQTALFATLLGTEHYPVGVPPGGREVKYMKRVIRFLLALLFLAAYGTPLLADGTNPPPSCTPGNCPAGK